MTKNLRATIIVILLVFMTIGLIYGLIVYVKYRDTLSTISLTDFDTTTDRKQEKQMEPFIMLLFGTSERENLKDFGHSDTIMLALVDLQLEKVQLISIPRDAYVDIPGYRKDKINAAYTRGGSELLQETLEAWLDLDIYAYTSINFQGFIDLVDLVGGIYVYVQRDMLYDDPTDGTSIRLTKGQQVLDGKKALDFVRFRKSNDGRHGSDYDRMERQQLALGVLSKELVSIRSITKAHEMMDILSANVKTSLTVGELDRLTKTFLTFNIKDFQTTSIQGGGIYENGVWYEDIPMVEVERIQWLIEDFLNHKNKN